MTDYMMRQGDPELNGWYRIRIAKGWFRGKDIFSQRLNQYERQLLKYPKVNMPLNAGNMIYTMMRKLTAGADWAQQSALMSAYRNLVYRLSRVEAFWYQNDARCISLEGQKSDVMWAVTFMSQVFFEEPMTCYLSMESTDNTVRGFTVQNGAYLEKDAIIEDDLPDIWDDDAKAEPVPQMQAGLVYDPLFVPQPGDRFALMDGRIGEYVRMDIRFQTGKTKGANVTPLERHNISASSIKDFEDMMAAQGNSAYDTYQMRYQAFMNKIHTLEAMIGGLEPSAYDTMPIAERGLPIASPETIGRTNAMDRNSLRYAYDNLSRGGLPQEAILQFGQDAMVSVMMRQNGYEMEYRMYTATGTSMEAAAAVFRDQIGSLYGDFMLLDALNAVVFPAVTYKNLCNVPSSGGPVMSEWEQQRIRLFGKGYLDYLDRRLAAGRGDPEIQAVQYARELLNQRYFNAFQPKQAKSAGQQRQRTAQAPQASAGTIQSGRRPLSSKRKQG